jgi:hypothetical protein
LGGDPGLEDTGLGGGGGGDLKAYDTYVPTKKLFSAQPAA